MYEFVCVGAYGYVYTIKWHNIVKTSISKQRGSPRKPTGLHVSSRVSRVSTSFARMPRLAKKIHRDTMVCDGARRTTVEHGHAPRGTRGRTPCERW